MAGSHHHRLLAVLTLISVASFCGVAVAASGDADQHLWGFSQNQPQEGKVLKLGNSVNPLQVYVAQPSTGKPEAAVILFPDVYGWDYNNTRIWADRLAKAGFLAVLPDWFRGDKFPGMSGLGEWIKRQPQERVLADFKELSADIRRGWPSVKKIGAQGFCWGGLYTAILSAGKESKVDAAVAFHASLLTPADIDAIKGPILFLQSDPKVDTQINSTFYSYIQKSFAAKQAKGLKASIKYFPQMPHGYALRGNMSDPAQRTAATAAFQEGLQFLKKELLPAAAAAAPTGGAAAAAAAAPVAAARPATGRRRFLYFL